MFSRIEGLSLSKDALEHICGVTVIGPINDFEKSMIN